METMIVIQDMKTKEYYWQYRIDEGFDLDINDAKIFESEKEALKELQKEYLRELFFGRVLELKKYIKTLNPDNFNN